MVASPLNPKQIAETLAKNRATSFGLTLVVGLPFAPLILTRVAAIQAEFEAQWPGRFHWYAPNHLHATIMAPLRGRYRAGPPLQRHELPADLAGFAEALNQCFAALEPFFLEFDRFHLAPDGRLLVFGADPGRVRSQVAERLITIPGLDRPKGLNGWHMTVGYLQTPTPFPHPNEQADFGASWDEIWGGCMGATEVRQVWLVHYADRTLSRILGKAPLWLGRPNALTQDRFLTELAIGQD